MSGSTNLEYTVQRFAQRLLLLGAALALAAIFYSLWHRWAGLTGSRAWRDAILYYVLPLAAIAGAFAFAGLWRGVDRLLSVLIVISVYLAMVCADLYLGYTAFHQEDAWSRDAAQRMNIPFDARRLAQVVADLRGRGLRAWPFIRIESDRDLITLGIVPNAIAVVCNEFGPWFTPKTDRYGFVNPDANWDSRTPFDAVVVGDSYAMGQCDPTTGGFAELLRKQGRQILNLGIGGNDPLLDLASLAEFGSMFKSRLVFWMHYAGNDLGGLNSNRKYPILRHYLDDPSFRQNLKDRMPEIERRLTALEAERYSPPMSVYAYILNRKGLKRALRLYTLRAGLGFARATEDDFDFSLFARVLTRAREIAAAMGAQLIVVNIPAAGQFRYDSVVEEKTASVVKSVGLRYVDLKTYFRQTGDYQALYSQGFKGHFSPKGNQVVAKILSDIVAENAKQ